VVRERRVVSTGYNGTPRGMTNCGEGGCEYINVTLWNETDLGTKAQGVTLESVPESDLIRVSASTQKRMRCWRREGEELETGQLYIAIRKRRSHLHLKRTDDY
jgi:deoxycytidylate deaminase